MDAAAADPENEGMDLRFIFCFTRESYRKKLRSMEADVLSKIEAALGAATEAGTRVPVSRMAPRLQETMDRVFASAHSPFVYLNESDLERYWKNIQDDFQAAEERGGYTPQELWEMLQAIQKYIDLRNGIPRYLREEQHQVLKTILEEAVPQMVSLNQQYHEVKMRLKFS